LKEISTLIPDIYNLLSRSGHKVTPENVDRLLSEIKDSVVNALETGAEDNTKSGLRLSKAGTAPRRVWFDTHRIPDGSNKPISGENLFKFLVGHVTEALLLFLAREAGHTVAHEQEEVTVAGIPGHIDAVIDGHLVDVKTASMYAFPKFFDLSVTEGNDPFGYMAQLSAYKAGLTAKGVPLREPSYFWAYNKSNSDMVLSPVVNTFDVEPVLEEQKKAVESDTVPPELCYPVEEFGKSGNLKINKQCSWCPHKFECFKDANDGKGLRVFRYSKNDEYLVKVAVEPKGVEEVTNQWHCTT